MTARASGAAALLVVLALTAAGCAQSRQLLGDPEASADPYDLCTPPSFDYTGWKEVRQGPISFKVPPDFRRSETRGHESGAWEQTWESGQRSVYAYTTRDAEQYRNLNPRCEAKMGEEWVRLGLIRFSGHETFGFHRERQVGGRWAAAGNYELAGPYGFRLYVTGRNDADTGELARAVMWSVKIDPPAEGSAAASTDGERP
jgi:hypothetical protein